MTAERVLIVEDFADSREMYIEFLQSQGFDVSGAVGATVTDPPFLEQIPVRFASAA